LNPLVKAWGGRAVEGGAAQRDAGNPSEKADGPLCLRKLKPVLGAESHH